MKKLLSIVLLLISFNGFSQYGNEWIEYSQKYYTVKIVEDGFYKVDYATLVSAGIPVSLIAPSNFQVFGFEKEQPILVEDGGDASFDVGDYILFYAQKNTTWLDSLMYDSPDDVSNRYYPHYNDTITYFLTWNNSTNNKRISIESDVSFGSYVANDFIYKKSIKEFHTYYAQGKKIKSVSLSNYTKGEGWSSYSVNALNASNKIDANLSTPFAFVGLGVPNVIGEAVSLGVSNANNGSNPINHHFQLQYGTSNTVLDDITYSGYDVNKVSFTFGGANITSSTTRIRHQLINDLGVAADHQSVAFVELTYAHLPNLEGGNYIEFLNENHPIANKSRYDFANFGGTTPYAFSFVDGIKKLPILNTAGVYQVLVPNDLLNQRQKLIVLDESEFHNVSSLSQVNSNGLFTNYSTTDFNDAYIIITHQSLSSSVGDYKLYRESFEGGSHNVVVAEVDELYLQFGGGVPKHAVGISRFQFYAYEKALAQKPNHVFIIGKGVREANESYIQQTQGIRQSVYAYNYCLVPTYGWPASDVLFTHDLAGNDIVPLIPIGRLAARDNSEVNIYLNKVKEYESQQIQTDPYLLSSKYWQKEILHFGGGSTTSEQNLFKNYLEQFETKLESSKFAGNVTSYYKDISDPIDPVTLIGVTDKINEGVSLMTFFGHAYVGGFDQNVDDPENWDNKGKYPVLISNSCLAGNIQEPNNISVSEEYILIPDKGSIAFIASVNNAFSSGLFDFSRQLMHNISDLHYGSTIGELIRYTIDDLAPTTSFVRLTAMTQMTLHGDPSLRLNPHDKPELEINASDFRIFPEQVDLTVDSIDVSIVVHNMGLSALDTFAIELTRGFPNSGGDSTYVKFINGIDYSDTIVFTIPFYANASAGINNFSIHVDQPSIVEEIYDELFNNQITKQIIFDIDGIYPIWPYDYAVVPNDTVTLKGSTINPFASVNSYRFEVDTTDLFNSPELRYSIKNSLGGVIETEYDEWFGGTSNVQSNLVLEDSMVYFWRVAVNDPTNMQWSEFSFQYIKGKTGWGQDHFFQFKKNEFSSLNYERSTRTRVFDPAGISIGCEVFGNAYVPQIYYTLWEIDGTMQDYGACTYNPAFMVCVVDNQTFESWGTRVFDAANNVMLNPDHGFGNVNDLAGCRNRVEKYFIFFQNDSMSMVNMQNMLINDVPDSNYVLIYTSRFIHYNSWDASNPELYGFFQTLGSDSIAVGKPAVPYICFYKKGAEASTFEEVYANDLNEHIVFEGEMIGYDYSGFETSTTIGPALEWDAVYWDRYALENPTVDTTRLKIFGLQINGSETLLIDTLFTANDSILNFNDLYSATDYPYLRLQSHNKDTIDFTPAQTDRWHVLYSPVPEAALTSVNGYYVSPTDTIFEGQKLAFAFDITNISDLPMDSILVNYWIEDHEHNIIPIPYLRQDSLRVGQIIRDTIDIRTLGLKNLNSLWVEINPYVSNSLITDQPERYHFNNIGQIPFYVYDDNENPILDVTFNGYHILNGDLIDPKSEVIMTLKDENQYLIMNEEADTASFGIYITDPNGLQKRLNFRNSVGEQTLEWIPANESSKKFKIIHNGDFKLDGMYRLLVQGADKSGNLSGDFSYDIEFEVDHKSSITNLMNYPNPFSTQTQFVFTLTGSVLPDEFTIQIMTISGKVVKEITVDELGAIHIGRNITDYRWNGKDEFGDILANGVYLYRVITKINGENIEHRESGADNYISKGFGKMYIIR